MNLLYWNCKIDFINNDMSINRFIFINYIYNELIRHPLINLYKKRENILSQSNLSTKLKKPRLLHCKI